MPPSVPAGTPTAYDYEAPAEDNCGGYDRFTLDVTHDGDMLAFDLAGAASYDVGAPTGTVTDVRATSATEQRLGNGQCIPALWSFHDDGETTLRLGSFDLAGNFSGWGDAVDLTPTEFDTGEGGSSGSGGNTGGAGATNDADHADDASGCSCTMPGRSPDQPWSAWFLTMIGATLACGRPRSRRP